MVVVAGPQNIWTYTKSSDMDGTAVTEGHFSINSSNSNEVTALPEKVFSTGTDFRELITTRGLQRTDEPQTERKLGKVKCISDG